MENSLKQRIIGAVVLAALAIIFLPAILKEKSSNGTFVSKIPEKPSSLKEYQINSDKINQLVAESESMEQSEQKRREQLAQSKIQTSEKIENPVAATAKSKLAKMAKNNAKPKPIEKQEMSSDKSIKSDLISNKSEQGSNFHFKNAAWVIQVASFSKQNNAINLVDKLKKKHFKAYRRKITTDKNSVYRVFVGPYINKPDAEKIIGKVNKISESSSLIKRFNAKLH